LVLAGLIVVIRGREQREYFGVVEATIIIREKVVDRVFFLLLNKNGN